VIVFELNARYHDLNRALGNANAITQFERVNNNFPVVVSANGLQVDGQNNDDWDQGLLFMNSSSVWAQAPLYVDRMVSGNYQPYAVNATSSTTLSEMSITATKSGDGKTLVLQVVNMTGSSKTFPITLIGFTPTLPTLQVTKLTGSLGAVNTASNPNTIVPAQSTYTHNISNGTFTYTFDGNSFTILKLQ
jgi:alpha-L-arabinofuranosidase